MSFLSRRAPGLVLLAASGSCLAQAPAPTDAAASAPAAAASAARGPSEVAQVTVIEDKNVRIEETRLRGQAQRITVQSKLGPTRPYEILVGPSGRDPMKDHGSAGQSAWSLFDF